MELQKVFESFRASCNNIKMFGDWAVNEDSDVINIRWGYAIFPHLLNEEGYDVQGKEYWLTHLSLKSMDYDLLSFGDAYDYAVSLLTSKQS